MSPEPDFPHASLIEGVRFTAQIAVPNLIQGLFRRRRTATAVAGLLPADGLARGFMEGLGRSYGGGPVWIRVAKDEALLALGERAIRHVLEQAPDPFAADAEPKKSAMEKFQPDALTISRGREWEDRRRFTETVLESDHPVHRFGDRFVQVASEEALALSGEVGWDAFNEAVRRAARRVILGDGAAEDAELSRMLGELMDKSNPPGGGDGELLARYTQRLRRHLDAEAPGSLIAGFAEAQVTERTAPERQLTHWLFALGDTLAINAARCLAVLAVDDVERERVRAEAATADLGSGAAVAGLTHLRGCLHEAMRLWPTTAMLARTTVRDTEWDGVPVPEGTQVLIVNTFNHRDRERLAWADRFSPEQWLDDGAAAGDWTFNHFSHGPQGCPGTAIALLVGQAMIAALLRERTVELLSPSLDPAPPLPLSLDFFALRFRLS